MTKPGRVCLNIIRNSAATIVSVLLLVAGWTAICSTSMHAADPQSNQIGDQEGRTVQQGDIRGKTPFTDGEIKLSSNNSEKKDVVLTVLSGEVKKGKLVNIYIMERDTVFMRNYANQKKGRPAKTKKRYKWEKGQWYNVTLTYKGDAITLKIDENTVFQVSDPGLDVKKSGFGISSKSGVL